MKKGIYICLGTLLILIAIVIIDTQFSFKEDNTMAGAAESSSADLSNIPLTQLDGSRLMVDQFEGRKVLVLIEPNCDACQRIALQIQKHAEAFEEHALYFVSDAPLPQLRQVASSYNLINQNTYIAQATTKDILHELGPVQPPAVFVFSEKGVLINSFVRETPIEEIIAFLLADTGQKVVEKP